MSSHAATPARSARSGRSMLALLAFLAAVAVAAGLGGIAASSAAETYAALELPGFAPPQEAFGPVWTVLYVVIAVAGWLVWREVGVDRAVVAWGVQLVLNAAWTPIFFAADAYVLALVEISLLLVAVVVTIVLFRPRQRAAALLLLPYLAWVGYATALTAGIVALN